MTTGKKYPDKEDIQAEQVPDLSPTQHMRVMYENW
jgi:hypothetical protein